MSMRTVLGLGLVSLLAGCSAAQSGADEADTTAGLGVSIKRCPDPTTDCSSTNGTGVYTAEEGFAGIDTMKLMLTRFINHGSYVTWVGRYFDAPSGLWLPMSGDIYYADYLTKQHLMVTAVRESSTNPTWTVYDNTTATYLNITGAQLLDLKVVITLTDPNSGGSKLYELGWNAVASDTTGRLPVRMFWMTWKVANSANAATPYCYDASWQKDPVVFQQGIAVNPVTAAVVRNDAFVTVSCRKGAIATAHTWGYAYRAGFNTYYFDSALQMKRASYCGDANHYTVAGTTIQIHDDVPIQNDPITYLEASWSPTGAVCLNKPNMRHFNMGFNGSCNGTPLPPCNSALPATYLVSGVPLPLP